MNLKTLNKIRSLDRMKMRVRQAVDPQAQHNAFIRGHLALVEGHLQRTESNQQEQTGRLLGIELALNQLVQK